MAIKLPRDVTLGIAYDGAFNCTVLRAVVLTQYHRVTDGQTGRRTDGRTELPLLVQRLQCEHCGAL